MGVCWRSDAEAEGQREWGRGMERRRKRRMKGDGEWEMAYYVCDLYGSRTPFSHLATWPPNQRPSVVTTQWQTTVLPSLSLCLCLCLFLCLSLSLTLSLLLPPGFLPPLLCFLYVISSSLRLLYSAFICFFPLALLSLSLPFLVVLSFFFRWYTVIRPTFHLSSSS